MSEFEDTSFFNFYQFPSWSTTITRPQTSLPTKTANDMFKIGIDNRYRNQLEISSKKRLGRQNIHLPYGLRVPSPPLLHQPTSTPDLCSAVEQLSTNSSVTPIPIRIKSATLTIPTIINSEGRNFPKQIHERRKITQERKRRKQQAQKYALGDSETWFQLRKSLVELKRLATTEEVLVDPTNSIFNCDGYSYDALKQAIKEQQEQKKINRFKSESRLSSSMDTLRSFNNRSRTSLTASQNSLSRSRIRQVTEIFPRSIFEPLIVTTKPIHPIILTGNNHSLKTKMKPPSSAPPRVRSSHLSYIEGKRVQLSISDLSINDDLPISSTPSPHLQYIKKQDDEEIRPKTSLKFPVKSKIKLDSQIPRCRSANDLKNSFLLNKSSPRFILITDQEHRIESWYHQYPFILSDDLIQTFQSKPIKSTVPAYFIDEQQQQTNNLNLIKKSSFQGKLFHINNDWKKYDLIFISNNIYQQIIMNLQTIIKLSGKLIHIYQINHNEDLKTQVRYLCKQFSSHT